MLNKFVLVVGWSFGLAGLMMILNVAFIKHQKTKLQIPEKKTASQPIKKISAKSAIPNSAVKIDPVFRKWSDGWTKAAIIKVKEKHGVSIKTAAEMHGVDPDVIVSVIGVESGGHNVRGKAGEIGPMQCKPTTCGKYIDKAKLPNAHYNILAGTSHIRDLQIKHDNDLTKAIAAYNRGSAPSNIDPEKDTYLRKFYHLLNKLKG